MKKKVVYIVLIVLAMVLVGSAAVAYAQSGATGPAGEHPPGPGPQRPGAGGEVTAVEGTTIYAENPRQAETILTDAETEFIINDEAGSLAEVEVGMFVRAEGERNEDGSFAASQLFASDEAPPRPQDGERPGDGPQRPGAGGEVTAVEGTTIYAENPRQAETILTDAETEFIINDEAGSLAEVEVGMFVRAEGERNEDGSFAASQLFASDEAPPRPQDGERPGDGHGPGNDDQPGRRGPNRQ